MAEIKVGDKVRLTQDVAYSNHKKGDIGVASLTNAGLAGMIRVRMEYNNTPEASTPFETHEIELVEDVKVFKVGDYLSEKDGAIVWKVAQVREVGGLLTEALFIQEVDDKVDVVLLAPVTAESLIKATPEQIEAFKTHTYWGKQEPVADAISPSVYQFPNGVEVRDISAHLTSFGGQAVQYIARATRLDGVVKGKPVEDLKKAIQLLEWEVERLEAAK